MANYFVLECLSPLRKAHYTLEVDYPASDLTWQKGIALSAAAEWENERPPPEPIEIRTVPETVDAETFVYPELAWMPIPLMSRRLVAALREAGVDNLQTFETVLTVTQGDAPPPPSHYLAVNILGLVAAADPQRSELNPDVPDRLVSADFHSLAVDEAKAHGLLLFRLAENTSAVLVHGRVKEAVEAGGIRSLSWIRPEEWAG